MNRTRILVLIPDPLDEAYTVRWQGPLSRLTAILEGGGMEVVTSPWTVPPPLDVAAATPLMAWGYHRQAQLWRQTMADFPLPLINAANVVRWNTDKGYLADLAARGAPILPTLTLDHAGAAEVSDAFDLFGTDKLVVKPRISAGSHLTTVVRRGESFTPFAGPALIQPFIPSVGTEGELSLFYFGGTFSHAARKVAAAGDFRVQPQFGGQVSQLSPDAEMFAVAEATLKAAPGPLTYARVDMVRDAAGALKLMELEAIEPDLYFDLTPDAGPNFAAAVLRRLTEI